MLKSLVTEWLGCCGRESAGDTSRVDIDWESLYWGVWPSSRLLLIICKIGQSCGTEGLKRKFRYDSTRFAHDTLDSTRRGGSGSAGRRQCLRATAGRRTRRRPARWRRRRGRRGSSQRQVAERRNSQV